MSMMGVRHMRPIYSYIVPLVAAMLLLTMLPFAVAQLMAPLEETPVEEVSTETAEAVDIFSIAEIEPLPAQSITVRLPSPPKESEVLNMKIRALPTVSQVQVTNLMLPSIRVSAGNTLSEQSASPSIIVRSKRMETARINDARCSYEQTKYVLATQFDCAEGIKHLDVKETPLYTSQYRPAVIETTFNTEKKPDVLRIVSSAEFPQSQSTAVYYRIDNTGAWKLLAPISMEKEPVATYIPLDKLPDGKKLAIRMESYLNKGTVNARDGSALVAINSIEVLDAQDQPGSTPGSTPTTPPPTTQPCTSSPDGCPPGDDTPAFTLARGSPLPKASAPPVNSPTPETEVTAETGQQSNENEGAPEVLEDTREGPTPIAGAAIARFLRENRAGVGLLLLIVAIVGTMLYQRSKGARKQRRAHLL